MESAVASSLESLLESVVSSEDSLLNLEIEELDNEEYGLPVSNEIPSLEDIINNDNDSKSAIEEITDASTLLEVKFLQGISQQIKSAEERSSVGAASTIALGIEGRVSVGTIHGHVLTFCDQRLLWVSTNIEAGAAVSSNFSSDAQRLLIGLSQGLVVQYEVEHGKKLRTIQLGGCTWGIMQICWAGTAALALDSGGSVYKLKFGRPFGVRVIQSLCLFSGSKEEVTMMVARSSRIAAFATLSRIVVVIGSKALACPLVGAEDQAPVLAYVKDDLVTARGSRLQWLRVQEANGRLRLSCVRLISVSQPIMWIGDLDGSFAWLGSDEKLRLWPEQDGFDLGTIRLVYSSAVCKGSCNMTRRLGKCNAGGVACSVAGGKGIVLGRDGVLMLRIRPPALRARAHIARSRYALAAQSLLNCNQPESSSVTNELLEKIRDNPSTLQDANVANAVVELCIQLKLSEPLWTFLLNGKGFEAIGKAAAAGRLDSSIAPSPPQASLLLRAIDDLSASRALRGLPLTSLDLHGEAEFARSDRRGLTLAALIGRLLGLKDALHQLQTLTKHGCGGLCASNECFGDALLTTSMEALTAQALADRSHALQLLLSMGILKTLLRHDAGTTCISLRRAFSEPPFVGPLGKHNRDSVVKEALETASLPEAEFVSEIIEWICSQIGSGNVSPELTEQVVPLLDLSTDDAWISLINSARAPKLEMLYNTKERPRVRRHLLRSLGRASEALDEALKDDQLNHREIDECLLALRDEVGALSEETIKALEQRITDFVRLKPRTLSLLLSSKAKHLLPLAINSCTPQNELELVDTLIETGSFTSEVALTHLKYLVKNNKGRVVRFLEQYIHELEPEKALDVVKSSGQIAATVVCLEAAGEFDGALQTALDAIAVSNCIQERLDLAKRAINVCERSTKKSPEEVAALLKDLFLKCDPITNGQQASFAALMMAAPGSLRALLAARSCTDIQSAKALLEWVSGALDAVRGIKRVQSDELHLALKSALEMATRGERFDEQKGDIVYIRSTSRCENKSTDISLNRTAPPRPDLESCA